jgi:hypothetical protein
MGERLRRRLRERHDSQDEKQQYTGTAKEAIDGRQIEQLCDFVTEGREQPPGDRSEEKPNGPSGTAGGRACKQKVARE